MALKVPQRTSPVAKAMEAPIQKSVAGIELLQRLSKDLEEINEHLKAQHMEIKLFAENLNSDPQTNFKPSLHVYLLDNRKEEPFFAAFSPSIQLSLNDENQIDLTFKTSRGLTSGVTHSKVLVGNPNESYSQLEDQINTFFQEASENLENGPH